MTDNTAGKAFTGGFMGCLGVLAAIVAVVLMAMVFSASRSSRTATPSLPLYVKPVAPVDHGPSVWTQGMNGVDDIEFTATVDRGAGYVRISCARGRVENVMFEAVPAMGDQSGEGAVTIASSAPGLGMMAVVIGHGGIWNVRTDAEQREAGRIILTSPRVSVQKAGGGAASFSTAGLAPLRDEVRRHCGV